MKESKLNRILNKLYGGLDMSWKNVILYAIATAVLTFIFLIFPVFKGTSFERMGVTFEAWVFFAVFILANTKTPLESALKTFVFFLISQPLIYLLQVPFSSLGWGLFGYYKYWFIWTLLTLPMAYIGWYIQKKNWLSVLILLPPMFLLASDFIGSAGFAMRHFPRLIITAVFCLAQMLIYAYTFTSDLKQKAVAFLLPLLIMGAVAFLKPPLDLRGTSFLPDDPYLSEAAEVTSVEGSDNIEIGIAETGEEPLISIHATAYGTVEMIITDGDQTYRYSVRVYEDDGGYTQTEITRLSD